MQSDLEVVPPEAVTPDWISRALKRKGIDATVGRLEMSAVGTGQLGETRRFRLEYTGAKPGEAPDSLVGNFPSADEVASNTGKDMGFYRSEVMFYRELAHRAEIKTPAVYVAEMDADTRDFVLLLEDMAPATAGDQMKGCTVAEARLALTEAAKLHSAFWNDTNLMSQEWLYVPEGAQGFYTTELMAVSYTHLTLPTNREV